MKVEEAAVAFEEFENVKSLFDAAVDINTVDIDIELVQ